MAAEQIIQPGKCFKIIPPPAAQVIPEKFHAWAKDIRSILDNAGLGRLQLLFGHNENGHMFLGYRGDYELVGRIRNILGPYC